jgi:hypothetical protein
MYSNLESTVNNKIFRTSAFTGNPDTQMTALLKRLSLPLFSQHPFKDHNNQRYPEIAPLS